MAMYTEIGNRNPGKNIRLIAPSSSAATVEKRIFDSGASALLSKGYSIRYSDKIFDRENSTSARIADLHDAFNDDSDIILTVRGGFEANDLIQELDYGLIKKSSKKFFGFSDTTVLLNAFFVKSEFKGIHGPNLITFAQNHHKDEIFFHFENALLEKYDVSVTTPYTDYVLDGAEPVLKEDPIFALEKGTAQGTIIGGNLSSFQLLFGTSYLPPATQDYILFIEEDDLCGKDSPQMFKRALASLSQQDIAKNIKGLVVGRFETSSLITPEYLESCVRGMKFLSEIPAVCSAAFGHIVPSGNFPIGGYCQIEANDTHPKIEIRNTE